MPPARRSPVSSSTSGTGSPARTCGEGPGLPGAILVAAEGFGIGGALGRRHGERESRRRESLLKREGPCSSCLDGPQVVCSSHVVPGIPALAPVRTQSATRSAGTTGLVDSGHADHHLAVIWATVKRVSANPAAIRRSQTHAHTSRVCACAYV